MKKKFIEEIFRIIFMCMRHERGRLTRISNTCHINRGKLTESGIASMKAPQFIILFYAMCLNMTESEFEKMMKDIYHTIVDKSAEYDFLLFSNDKKTTDETENA